MNTLETSRTLAWPRGSLVVPLVVGLLISLGYRAAEAAEREGPRPEPTGPWAVGTSIHAWADAERLELATEDPDDHRQLIVQIWYPSTQAPDAEESTFRGLEELREVFSVDDVALLKETGSSARVEAPWAPGLKDVPVMLFVHGWQSQSAAYTSLLEDLASHGLVVVGVDQPFQGRIALPNGDVTPATEDHFGDPMQMVATYGGDLRFVLDRLTDLNDAPGLHQGHFGLDKVILSGHSNGALSALAAADDPRVDAIVSLDKWEPVFETIFRPVLPFLLLRTGGAEAPSAEYRESLPNPRSRRAGGHRAPERDRLAVSSSHR